MLAFWKKQLLEELSTIEASSIFTLKTNPITSISLLWFLLSQQLVPLRLNFYLKCHYQVQSNRISPYKIFCI